MTNEEIKKLINTADEDLLRKYAGEWAVEHEDFGAYIVHALNPPTAEIAFAEELARVVRNNTYLTDSRYYERLIVDWSNILYRLIEPWGDDAESFSNERLQELVEAIITEVGMHVQEDDFLGDGWHSDDFSGQIGDIMEWLGHLSGLLLIREDLSEEAMLSLQSLVKKAKKNDVAEGYVGTPYENMLQMIKLRLGSGEITCGIFDIMISANYLRKAGDWVCRKIDFIREMGLEQEAHEYMEANLEYPAVSLKRYDELMAGGDWQEAIKHLEKANALTGDKYWSSCPNWLEMKYELLKEHGDKQAQIEVLSELFRKHWDEKYYHQLKEMVDSERWTDFYHNLLKCEATSWDIERVAPFLIEEKEFDWLYQLICQNFDRFSSDYRIAIAYAKELRPTHGKEMQGLIVRSFREYAASRFAPKQKVNSSKYKYFREALSSLSGLGYAKEQRELVEFFLEEYRRRPSLVSELMSIKLQDESPDATQ